jgi:hypothetical protein
LDASWRFSVTLGAAAIWVSVVLISLFAPELISGSEQQALPLAAFVTWIWGVIGTVGFLWSMGRLRWRPKNRSTWTWMALICAVLWLTTAVIAMLGPVVETGSDPTQLPVWALGAPAVAAGLTVLLGVVSVIFAQEPPESARQP